MSELKACPFCGGANIKKQHEDGQFWNTCQTCFADGPPTCKRGSGHDWNARALPEGYVLVPVEPTGKMIDAAIQALYACESEFDPDITTAEYKAMLAAAQEVESE